MRALVIKIHGNINMISIPYKGVCERDITAGLIKNYLEGVLGALLPCSEGKRF